MKAALIYFVFEQVVISTFKVHNIRAGKQAYSRLTLAVVVGSFEKKRTFTAKASTEFIIQIDWRPHCPLTKAGGLSVPRNQSIFIIICWVARSMGQ